MKEPSSEQMIKTATNSKNPSSPLPLSPFPSLSLFSLFSSSLRLSGFFFLSTHSSSYFGSLPPKEFSPTLFFSIFFFIFGSFSPTFSTSHVLRLKTWEGGVMWVCGCVSVWGTLCPPLFWFFFLYFIILLLFFKKILIFFVFFCIFVFLLFIYIYIYIYIYITFFHFFLFFYFLFF